MTLSRTLTSDARARARPVETVGAPAREPDGAVALAERARPIRAVVFDKDGTLFDFQATWGAWCSGMIEDEAGGDAALAARLAEALGYDTGARRFRPDSVIASPTEDLADRLVPLLRNAGKDEIVARMDRRAATAPQIEAAPLRDLLTRLAGCGLHLGVATNDVEASARAHLRAAGVEGLFGFIACIDSGWGAKPEPGQLLAFARAVNVDPGDCLMVGDSLHDLRAARAAGMRAVAVLTGLTDRETLEPAADAVLASVAELPEWIAQAQAVQGPAHKAPCVALP